MKFVYRKYQGEPKEHELTKWVEEGNYILGVCIHAGAFRTFRKDRVISYIDGSDALLRDPRPNIPPRLPSKQAVSSEKRRDAPPPGVPQVLFTGFSAVERAALEKSAWEAGLFVRKNSVTKELTFLCTGPNAGPMKIKRAREQGTYIVPGRHFHALIETGELCEED